MNDTRAVIINVDTRPVTVLAVLSLVAGCRWPLTLVECSRDPAEARYFRRLADYLGIGFQRLPLLPHGRTLDRLFRETDAERLLLMDSDAELLDSALLPELEAGLAEPQAFGSGFRQQGNWAVEAGIPYAWYAERMWIPLCLMNVAAVRQALDDGVSFMHRKHFNDIGGWPRLSRLLAARRHVPGLRRLPLDWLKPWRREYFGERPSFVYYDTGADVFAHLIGAGYRYAELDWSWQRRCVAHHHGVTRRRLRRLDRNSVAYGSARDMARAAIRERYPDALPVELLP